MGDLRTSFTLPKDLRAPNNSDQSFSMRGTALVFNYRALCENYDIDLDVAPLQTEIESAANANTPY